MKMCRRLARELVAIMDELAASHLEQENPMRTEPEQALALECLKLAIGNVSAMPQLDPVAEAHRFYAFVTGADRAAAANAAKAAIDELAR